MIDMHTHILPEIDDGARSMEQTILMLKEAKKAGFSQIITTSHYIENEYDVPKNDRDIIIDAIQESIDNEKINIKLYNGAEAYISDVLVDLVNENIVPTLADSRYVLFELSLSGSKVLYLNQVIEDLITNRYTPIIAHPERYEMVQNNPNIAVEWVKKGVLLQSNYASIIERYGRKCKQTLLKLLEANAIHFLGTDCHRPDTIYTQMEEIISEFEKEIGKEKLEELSTVNPKKVLSNEKIYIEEPNEIIKKHWFNR